MMARSNNSVEVNLLEVVEKEDFQYDQLTTDVTETDSPAGKIGQQLQLQTVRNFQRRR